MTALGPALLCGALAAGAVILLFANIARVWPAQMTDARRQVPVSRKAPAPPQNHVHAVNARKR